MAQDKRHPKTVYDSKYPYNRVEITESGHEIHYDDTPGKERIRRSHMSGTYEEISHDGKRVVMNVGNLVEYSKQGKTTTVDKNHDEKIGGSSRVSVMGGSHTEVKGNHSVAVDGDHKTMIGGDHVMAVKGDHVQGVTGKTKLRLGGALEIKGDDKKDLKIDGAANCQFGSTLEIYSKDKNYTHSDNDITVESATNIILKVSGSSITITDSSIALTVGSSTITITDGKIVLDSPEVHVTEGGQQISPTSFKFVG